METFEMRYFLATAEYENVGQAASRLAVSPPAVSRAIARIEGELGVQLFERIGRNIALTDAGRRLQGEISRIVSSLDEIKHRYRPSEHHVGISLKGTEFGLSSFSSTILHQLRNAGVKFSIEMKAAADSKAVERAVMDGEALLGIVTGTPSNVFNHKSLGVFRSRTYVGPGHELYSFAKEGKRLDIQAVLKHEFVSFLEPIFPENESVNRSTDGWRDDQFRRRVALRTDSIEAAIKSVECGIYLSYLPESIASKRDLLPMLIDGCPYKCETESFLITKKDQDLSWMRPLF